MPYESVFDFRQSALLENVVCDPWPFTRDLESHQCHVDLPLINCNKFHKILPCITEMGEKMPPKVHIYGLSVTLTSL